MTDPTVPFMQGVYDGEVGTLRNQTSVRRFDECGQNYGQLPGAACTKHRPEVLSRSFPPARAPERTE